ncbi:predicted protein [Histoplasma mississippiense (nom. inval.)]|uniref:predicted protein n=1 Tax=Ajellomyces capsulatus (strain NAm1 / WU24) TaxID=2059318 RepID=UPI000157C3DB|nr:predicted protein [Histoplasma mississippiense (nom. inval.)]EDN07492.1 predicted protein [Histoplasma mississippiense (nom. inval.)]
MSLCRGRPHIYANQGAQQEARRKRRRTQYQLKRDLQEGQILQRYYHQFIDQNPWEQPLDVSPPLLQQRTDVSVVQKQALPMQNEPGNNEPGNSSSFSPSSPGGLHPPPQSPTPASTVSHYALADDNRWFDMDGPSADVDSFDDVEDRSQSSYRMTPEAIHLVEHRRSSTAPLSPTAEALSPLSSPPSAAAPPPQAPVSILAQGLAEQLQQHHGCLGDSHWEYPFDMRPVDHPSPPGTPFPSKATPSRPIHSVRLSEIIQWACPDILSRPQIAQFGEPWDEQLPPLQRQKIFSGLDVRDDSTPPEPPTVDIASEDVPDGPLMPSKDIDSVGGFASSLAVARAGIHWLAARPPVSSLQAGLHLSPIPVTWEPSSEASCPRRSQRPIHQIPHLPLGRLGGFEDLELYALFPKLHDPERQHFIIREDEYRLWTDQIVLPALHECYSTALLGHIPSSTDHIRLNATARWVEGRLQTQSRTWMEMHKRFLHRWELAVDPQFIEEEFIDIGKEICPPQSYLATQQADQIPGTVLWRRCCLQSFARWCGDCLPESTTAPDPSGTGHESQRDNGDTEEDSGVRATLLPVLQHNQGGLRGWGITMPSGLNTWTPLLWTQAWSACGSTLGRGVSHQPLQVLQAYLHTKQRCHRALEASRQKAFAVREEYRVSGELYRAIHAAMQDQGWVDEPLPQPASSLRPFHHQPTPLIMDWLRWNINRLCTGFEMVYSLRQRNLVQWEHTRVMMMFLQCLQHMYGGQGRHLRHSNGLWLDRVVQPRRDGQGERVQEGMGFQSNLRRYQYAWMCDKLDWTAMIFKPAHRAHLTFNTPTLQQAFHHRYGQVNSAKRDFLLVQDLLARMRDPATTTTQARLLLQLCIDTCLRAFRKEVFTHLDQGQRVSWRWQPQQRQQALAGEIALTWAGLQLVFPELTDPGMIHAVAGHNMRVRSISVLFTWLWGWEGDGNRCILARQHWVDKPYRLLFQQCFGEVALAFGVEQARAWRANLRSIFIRTHWLLPYPSSTSFWSHGGQRRLQWWSSVHPGVQQYVRKKKKKQQPSPDPAPLHIEPWEVVHLPLSGWERSSSVMQGIDIRLPSTPDSIDDFLTDVPLEPTEEPTMRDEHILLPVIGQSVKLIYSTLPDIAPSYQLRSHRRGEHQGTPQHDPAWWKSHLQSYLQRLIQSKHDAIQSLKFAQRSRQWQSGPQPVQKIANTEPDSDPESLSQQYIQEVKQLQALKKQERKVWEYNTRYMHHWQHMKSLQQQSQSSASSRWSAQEWKSFQEQFQRARHRAQKYEYQLRKSTHKITEQLQLAPVETNTSIRVFTSSRSGYEIQHIQIKSDNSAGKGLHCGVKVNELRPSIDMEHQLFVHCESYLIIICRRCKHAVWPTEIERHLKGKAHQLKHAVVQQIKENIEQWGWNGRPFHSGLENRPIRAGQIGRRSGYEIQHIQIKSDNSAGKGLHCGVKVNELSRTRWTLSRWTSNPSNQESEMESQQGETHIRFNSTCSPRMARSVSKSTDNNINESITKNEASTIASSVGLCKISVVSLVYIIRDLIE